MKIIDEDSSDADGALDVLEKRMLVLGKTIVILGAGGSAKAVAYEAKKRGAEVTLCSRRFGNLDQIPIYDVLINTIPVEVDHDPIPGSVVYDINFNRKNSPLMERAKAKSCQLIFGFRPAAICVSTHAGTTKDKAATNIPIEILRSAVKGNILLIAG